jgi:hypothetical protein
MKTLGDASKLLFFKFFAYPLKPEHANGAKMKHILLKRFDEK